jgi:RNA polymerase sigma-70 factor (ECF subfamily)
MRGVHADLSVVPIAPASAGAPATSEDPTAALIDRAKRDDMAAWSLLYRTHYRGVLRHVCSLVGSQAIAEDLTQETFARAFSGLASFGGKSAFSTWLHGVGLNVVRGYWRTRTRTERTQQALEIVAATRELTSGDLDGNYQRHRRVQVLYAVLDELSEALREAFVLRYVEGLSATEAGQQLGVEAGAVRVRAHRARKHVEMRLVELGWTAPSMEGPA